MSTTIEKKALLKGAHFIIESSAPASIFTPEDFNEEQNLIQETVQDFIDQDFAPLSDRLEQGEHDLNKDLLKKLGDLGILGAHMPEEFGGMELDINTNTIIFETLGQSGAFSTTFGAHTGIGMLPILYYGTEEQKSKYLPELITGEKVACYCLTEPGSGSDALAAKTRADLSPDGKHYILNGQKMWISNAGFADVFIVFAKIHGTDFTGFIVDRDMPGLSLGAEEKKLGIKGSSTRQVFFENLKVPVENLLGNQGEGHLIAFNVLNTGRYKIGPGVVGASKKLVSVSAKYANERKQFGKSISSFGAIQSKLADQTIKIYAAESAVFRTSGLIQDQVELLKEEGKESSTAKLEAAEEYALESSILKIAATDILAHVVDEAVQIHGGIGYSEESAVARAYRDARISKIYEGTNEINRMLMINLIFKRAMKGKLDFASAALQVQQELITGTKDVGEDQDPEMKAVEHFKKISLMLIGSVGQLAMQGKLNLKSEQELMMNLADVLIYTYLSESTLLRTLKNPSPLKKEITTMYIREASDMIRIKALEAIGTFAKPSLQAGFVKGVDALLTFPLVNSRDLRRSIAKRIIEKEAYVTA
jgi:alkylation response protein AidB-like acyl-CoA dehydrogenase